MTEEELKELERVVNAFWKLADLLTKKGIITTDEYEAIVQAQEE